MAIDKESFLDILDEIDGAKGRCDDANTANMTVYKKAEELGHHRKALKAIHTLDRMDHGKRVEYLRWFDKYRAWMEWGEQTDLEDIPETAGDDDAPVVADDDEPEIEIEGPEVEATETAETRDPDAEAAPPVQDAAEWHKGPEETDPASLDEAGFTFAEGQRAGGAGEPVSANPHPVEHPSHGLWARGHDKGSKKRTARRPALSLVGNGDDSTPQLDDEAPSVLAAG